MPVFEVREVISATYLKESRRIYASLVGALGDFDLAEDALHEAFKAALEQWPVSGIPQNQVAWLIAAGRFKGIDAMRRRSRLDSIDRHSADLVTPTPEYSSDPVEDERLSLIFTCCHPAIGPDAQIALTLREVCGLTTEEIAHAFLQSTPTLAQRIVRAKAKIKDARIPFALPDASDLPDRLASVLKVIYLVFNEGYSASFGDELCRSDLSGEAIRLGRLLAELLPDPEVDGLLGLMLLTDARRGARSSAEGELIPLEEQNRSLWETEKIQEGAGLVERSLRSRGFGPFTLQAAIYAVHCEAPTYEETDWNEVVGLYEALARLDPSPIICLNLAVAIAMRDGPSAGLARVEALLATGELNDYHLAHAARADLYRRLGNLPIARAAYLDAIRLVQQAPERRFLERKVSALEKKMPGMSNL